MKRFLPILLVPTLSISALAQEYQAAAILSKPNGENLQAYIITATKTEIRYKTSQVSTDTTDAKIVDFSTIHLMEPPEFSAAVDLFEGRKYKEAQEKFAAFKDISKRIAGMKDNHHTLSAFYEMECMRKLSDYEGLQKALQSFIKEPLTRDYQLRQLDLYVMWDAVRTESWDRLIIIASERDEEKLPGDQRAQVAFCKGLALENLNRPAEALIEYGIAVTADSGASELITQEAALYSLGIYFKDEEVQAAISTWGTEDENKNSPGHSHLLEAAALAKFYQKFLSVGKPLTEEYKKFLKYGQGA
jgi:tetratricopeptide (TPR) repeat protein